MENKINSLEQENIELQEKVEQLESDLYELQEWQKGAKIEFQQLWEQFGL
tara:strand:+ start:111 stop:260 length:150 start_codon:yes stop_codon:yes gene_type:complete